MKTALVSLKSHVDTKSRFVMHILVSSFQLQYDHAACLEEDVNSRATSGIHLMSRNVWFDCCMKLVSAAVI